MAYSYKHRKRLSTARETVAIDWADEDQRFLFQYPPYPLCASGGQGASKTVGWILKIVYLCHLFPGMRWVICRRRFTDLQRTTMSTFFKWVPQEAYSYGGRRSDADKHLRFNNGSEIFWLHLDDIEEATSTILGLEINGFLLDQGEEIEEEIFEKLMGRLGRWEVNVPDWLVKWYEIEYKQKWPWRNDETGRLEAPTYAGITCNPDSELHWIYRRFHPESADHAMTRIDDRGEPRKSFRDQGYFMLFMDSTKNKFLSKRNKEIMLSNDPSYIRRYVRGLWGIPEGQIHDIHRSSIIPGDANILEYLISHCTLMRVLDHGDTAPTACTWWAIDSEGNWFCYREYYMPDKLITDHRRNITGLSGFEKYTFNIADPQIFYKTAQKHGGMWSVADEYADCIHYPRENALFLTPGDNDELSTRNRINELLKWDPKRIHPITKERGAAKMFFLKRNPDYPNGCDHTIREIMAQRRERIGSDMGKPIFSDDREKKVADHAYDTVRYGVASQAPSQVEKSPEADYRSAVSIHARAISKMNKKAIKMLGHRAKQQARLLGFTRG